MDILLNISDWTPKELFKSFIVSFIDWLVATISVVLKVRIISCIAIGGQIFCHALAFANIGYFGYPVVGAVFGEAVKASMILFCIPQTIAINTYGYKILTEIADFSGEPTKNLRIINHEWLIWIW